MSFQTTNVVALLLVLEAFLADDDKVEGLFDEIDDSTPQLGDPSVAPFKPTVDLYSNNMVPDFSRCAAGLNGVTFGNFSVTQCPPVDNRRIDPIPFIRLFKTVDFVISFEPVNLWRLYGTAGDKKETDTYTEQSFSLWGHTYTQFSVSCPDHGTPASPEGLVDILDIVKDHPTLIHCLAGVGRSFIPVYYRLMMRKIENGEPLDFAEIMREMRERRPGALQTPEQFSFAIKMVVEKLGRSISVEKSNPDTKRKGSEKEKGEDKKSKPDVAEHDHPSSP
jgi:hypothetical protein